MLAEHRRADLMPANANAGKLTVTACCQVVYMDRAEMATTIHSTGNRPGQPVTRDLRCVFRVPSAPRSREDPVRLSYRAARQSSDWVEG